VYWMASQALWRVDPKRSKPPVSTHAFRHTYRSWLDATGAAISVQQKMMRHASIKTTMDIYGDVVTDEMSTASRKVAELVFPSNGAQAERKAS
jgi:integrase